MRDRRLALLAGGRVARAGRQDSEKKAEPESAPEATALDHDRILQHAQGGEREPYRAGCAKTRVKIRLRFHDPFRSGPSQQRGNQAMRPPQLIEMPSLVEPVRPDERDMNPELVQSPPRATRTPG